MFTEKDNHIKPEEAKEHDDDRVAVTSQDVALINSDQQALVSAKEKSTKEKVITTSILISKRIGTSQFVVCDYCFLYSASKSVQRIPKLIH